MTRRTVRVGNAGGYWGDDPTALLRQLSGGPLDYVTQDFLAEVTMSILQKQRSRNPELGYAVDFLDQLQLVFQHLEASPVRLISNAGGINPLGCAEEVSRLARAHGSEFEIAAIDGDDLMDRIDALLERGHQLENMETGEAVTAIRDRILSANVYLGASPVVHALRSKARIVITGRVTDTGITTAAPMFEFDWKPDDWNRLAAGVVAGHILECGAQATGGNLSDWREVPSFVNIGYPIVEFEEDGSFEVTKHPGSGGLVNRKTVISQLIYEMGDPRRYLTPDVIADFTSFRVEESGDRVRIRGVRGQPPPDTLKVSISYSDGYKAAGTLLVSGPDVVDKARRLSESFWSQLQVDFQETLTELVGFNACHGFVTPLSEPQEVLVRLSARDPNAEKLEEFARRLTAVILSSVSGVAIVGARPRIQEVVAYWPCLIPATEVTPCVTLLSSRKRIAVPVESPLAAPDPSEPVAVPPATKEDVPSESLSGKTIRVRLQTLCYARSGDKGDTANIGIVARSPQFYDWLKKTLTAERVQAFFGPISRGKVERFEVPNLTALNFLLHEALGGGGTVSLRIDPQGKTLADGLLMMEIEAPVEWAPEVNPNSSPGI